MYLKILVEDDGEGKRTWRIIGGIRRLGYSIMNNWTWKDYEFQHNNSDCWIGPMNEEEWAKASTNKGYRKFATASINFEDDTFINCIWDTVAYLLGNDGKTIEVISAAG